MPQPAQPHTRTTAADDRCLPASSLGVYACLLCVPDHVASVVSQLETRSNNRIQHVDVPAEDGSTALMLATEHNALDVVRTLIDKKARLDLITQVRPTRRARHLDRRRVTARALSRMATQR